MKLVSGLQSGSFDENTNEQIKQILHAIQSGYFGPVTQAQFQEINDALNISRSLEISGHVDRNVQQASSTQLTQSEIIQLQAEAESVALKTLTPEQLKEVEAEAQAATFSKLTPEQCKELEDEAQAIALSRMTQHQIEELQVQTQAAALKKLTPQQIDQIQSEPRIAAIRQLTQHPVAVNPDVNVHQQAERLSTVQITRSDGQRVEYLVNEDTGDEFSSLVQQADISNRSQNTRPMIQPPSVSQPFPAHTVRNLHLSQYQLLQHSQLELQQILDLQSDTSSTIPSEARSVLSGGSAAGAVTFSGSASTR